MIEVTGVQTIDSRQPDLLVLRDDLLINRGKGRLCFRHPADRDLVVKVAAGDTPAQRSANDKEYRGYRDLLRRHGRLNCISHCHGFIATDRGTGLLCDCIRNADGTIAQTIYDIILRDDHCDLEAIMTIARSLGEYLWESDIRLFDLNPKNIALVKDARGAYRPIVLDLKGRFDNNESIPFSSYIRFFARRKIRRRVQQLLERIVFFRKNRERFGQEARGTARSDL